jgi:hypothetical protein
MKVSMRKLAVVAALPILIAGVSLAQQRPPRGGAQGGQGGGQQGGGGGQGGQQGSGPTSRPSPDQLFDQADTDHNGVLSRAEFSAFLKSHRPPRPPKPPEDNN